MNKKWVKERPDTIGEKLTKEMFRLGNNPLPEPEDQSKPGIHCPSCGHSHKLGSQCENQVKSIFKKANFETRKPERTVGASSLTQAPNIKVPGTKNQASLPEPKKPTVKDPTKEGLHNTVHPSRAMASAGTGVAIGGSQPNASDAGLKTIHYLGSEATKLGQGVTENLKFKREFNPVASGKDAGAKEASPNSKTAKIAKEKQPKAVKPLDPMSNRYYDSFELEGAAPEHFPTKSKPLNPFSENYYKEYEVTPGDNSVPLSSLDSIKEKPSSIPLNLTPNINTGIDLSPLDLEGIQPVPLDPTSLRGTPSSNIRDPFKKSSQKNILMKPIFKNLPFSKLNLKKDYGNFTKPNTDYYESYDLFDPAEFPPLTPLKHEESPIRQPRENGKFANLTGRMPFTDQDFEPFDQQPNTKVEQVNPIKPPAMPPPVPFVENHSGAPNFIINRPAPTIKPQQSDGYGQEFLPKHMQEMGEPSTKAGGTSRSPVKIGKPTFKAMPQLRPLVPENRFETQAPRGPAGKFRNPMQGMRTDQDIDPTPTKMKVEHDPNYGQEFLKPHNAGTQVGNGQYMQRLSPHEKTQTGMPVPPQVQPGKPQLRGTPANQIRNPFQNPGQVRGTPASQIKNPFQPNNFAQLRGTPSSQVRDPFRNQQTDLRNTPQSNKPFASNVDLFNWEDSFDNATNQNKPFASNVDLFDWEDSFNQATQAKVDSNPFGNNFEQDEDPYASYEVSSNEDPFAGVQGWDPNDPFIDESEMVGSPVQRMQAPSYRAANARRQANLFRSYLKKYDLKK